MRGFVRELLAAFRRPAPHTRLLPAQPPRPGSERAAVVLLLFSACAFAGFVAAYVASGDTQWLGLALGLGLTGLGVAMAIASRRLVPQETAVEPRPSRTRPHPPTQ